MIYKLIAWLRWRSYHKNYSLLYYNDHLSVCPNHEAFNYSEPIWKNTMVVYPPTTVNLIILYRQEMHKKK